MDDTTRAEIRWIATLVTTAGALIILGMQIQRQLSRLDRADGALQGRHDALQGVTSDLARRVCLLELRGRAQDTHCPEYLFPKGPP